MKSDFMIALTQLAAERNLPKETILRTVEAALVSAFKKENFTEEQNVSVKIIPQTGEVKVYAQKVVVEEVLDSRQEISLKEARRHGRSIRVGQLVEVESTPQNAGRIAAQTAKQVVLQRLREAERDAVYGEFADKEGELVSGIIQRIEPRELIIDVGKALAVMPLSDQVRTERYREGQRLRLYLKDVLHSGRGPQLVVSRSHPNLLRRLLELEVPEIHSGIVELKAIARESGQRSKIAVTTSQEGVDPVGCCVGLRGIRIQNITKEMNGEKIDITLWDPSPATFIANALSPAPVAEVEIDEEANVATVIVPDKQLSLAIGKEGQNARLAAKITGWRIDIKSVSMAEADRGHPIAEEAPLLEEASEVAPSSIEDTSTVPVMEPEQIEELEPIEAVMEMGEVPAEEPSLAETPDETQPQEITDAILSVLDDAVGKISKAKKTATGPKTQLRFAEDLAQFAPHAGEKPKAKKKKKSARRAFVEDETVVEDEAGMDDDTTVGDDVTMGDDEGES
jgi:N utilization substance protein A